MRDARRRDDERVSCWRRGISRQRSATLAQQESLRLCASEYGTEAARASRRAATATNLLYDVCFVVRRCFELPAHNCKGQTPPEWLSRRQAVLRDRQPNAQKGVRRECVTPQADGKAGDTSSRRTTQGLALRRRHGRPGPQRVQ
ncbi:hypothetical protein ERJ75_000116500 [Trypanosoma vivax]|nr:hypothetical protein ERJ75_000116500 [Trypanosoma vivax]